MEIKTIRGEIYGNQIILTLINEDTGEEVKLKPINIGGNIQYRIKFKYNLVQILEYIFCPIKILLEPDPYASENIEILSKLYRLIFEKSECDELRRFLNLPSQISDFEGEFKSRIQNIPILSDTENMDKFLIIVGKLTRGESTCEKTIHELQSFFRDQDTYDTDYSHPMEKKTPPRKRPMSPFNSPIDFGGGIEGGIGGGRHVADLNIESSFFYPDDISLMGDNTVELYKMDDNETLFEKYLRNNQRECFFKIFEKICDGLFSEILNKIKTDDSSYLRQLEIIERQFRKMFDGGIRAGSGPKGIYREMAKEGDHRVKQLIICLTGIHDILNDEKRKTAGKLAAEKQVAAQVVAGPAAPVVAAPVVAAPAVAAPAPEPEPAPAPAPALEPAPAPAPVVAPDAIRDRDSSSSEDEEIQGSISPKYHRVKEVKPVDDDSVTEITDVLGSMTLGEDESSTVPSVPPPAVPSIPTSQGQMPTPQDDITGLSPIRVTQSRFMSPSSQGIVDGNLDSPDIQLYTGSKREREEEGGGARGPASKGRRPARLKYTKKKNKKRTRKRRTTRRKRRTTKRKRRTTRRKRRTTRRKRRTRSINNKIEQVGGVDPLCLSCVAGPSLLSMMGYGAAVGGGALAGKKIYSKFKSKKSSSSIKKVGDKIDIKRNEELEMNDNGKKEKLNIKQNNNVLDINGKKKKYKSLKKASEMYEKKIKSCLKKGFKKCV